MNMFERCRTPLEIAHELRNLYGLPVQLLAGRPMVTTGSVLSAIVMPPELGRNVLATLDRTHPAFTHMRDEVSAHIYAAHA